MNVGELKAVLADLDDNLELICQRDPEGNGFSQLSGADSDAVYANGTVYDTNWSAEDCCLEQDEWDELKSKPRCVVLFPQT